MDLKTNKDCIQQLLEKYCQETGIKGMILRSDRCLDVESGVSRGREQKDGWSSGPRVRLGPGQQRYLFGRAR